MTRDLGHVRIILQVSGSDVGPDPDELRDWGWSISSVTSGKNIGHGNWYNMTPGLAEELMVAIADAMQILEVR